MNRQASRHGKTLIAIAVTAFLAACGSSSNDLSWYEDDGHDHEHVETAGRLAIIESGSKTVRVYDLDSESVAATFTLTNAASAVYASPGNRYAVVFQNVNDQVQLIDGGIWQEDHGDHLHDYMEDPKLLDFSISGVRPSHYQASDGLAAIFMDGLAGSGQVASVAALTDASISLGRTEAGLDLPATMHGTAEPRGQYLLTTWRDPASTQPHQVELYRRDGTGYTFVKRFEEQCPSLHGSASNENHTAFGCLDGVLVVSRNGDDFTAQKIDNPASMPAGARISTVAGHHHIDSFVGIASPGSLFAIDPAAGRIEPIQWVDGRTRRAHAFDIEGEQFMVLDDLGILHLLDAHDWALKASLPVIRSMPAARPFPAIVVNAATQAVYVSDPVEREIAVIDLEHKEIEERLALDFSPAGLVWLGMPEHEHGDDHDHDHAH